MPPLLAKTEPPAVAPCPSSKRRATPPKQGEELAKTTRSKARRRAQGKKAKLCRFCLADIPTTAARCRHCTSVLNYAEWRHRCGRHISMASRTKAGRQRTAGGQWAHPRTRTASPRRRAQTANVNATSAHASNTSACRARAQRSIATTAKPQGGVGRGRTATARALGALHGPCHTTARAGIW